MECFESTRLNHADDGKKQSGIVVEKGEVRVDVDLDSSDREEAIARSIHELNRKVFSCRTLDSLGQC